MMVPGVQVGFFRRKFTELEGADGPIDRSLGLFTQAGATYNGSKHTWSFPNGSKFRFAHCNNEANRFDYQSQAFDILIFDEATHFTWKIIDYLLTRNRASKTSQLTQPFALFLTNPGGVGLSWFIKLFDILKAKGEHGQVKQVINQSGQELDTYFIPAFIADNPIGQEKDPDYEERLKQSDPNTAAALINGDWTVFQGQAFPQWDYALHACEPFPIPDNWPVYRASDYGYNHPFDCLWRTQDPGTGIVYIFREVNASGLTDRQQARRIKEATLPGENVLMHFAGHDYWNQKNVEDVSTCAADEYAAEGIYLTKADIGRVSGKQKIDRLLAIQEHGQPGMKVFRGSCKPLIEIMPLLVISETNPEDVQKMDGDDPYDCLRYVLTNVRDKQPDKPKAKPRPNTLGGKGF